MIPHPRRPSATAPGEEEAGPPKVEEVGPRGAEASSPRRPVPPRIAPSPLLRRCLQLPPAAPLLRSRPWSPHLRLQGGEPHLRFALRQPRLNKLQPSASELGKHARVDGDPALAPAVHDPRSRGGGASTTGSGHRRSTGCWPSAAAGLTLNESRSRGPSRTSPTPARHFVGAQPS